MAGPAEPLHLGGRGVKSQVQNAVDAENYAAAQPGDVLAALRAYGAPVERFIENLTHAELRGEAWLEFIGAEWTAEEVVRAILIGHVRSHLASIAAAIAE